MNPNASSFIPRNYTQNQLNYNANIFFPGLNSQQNEFMSIVFSSDQIKIITNTISFLENSVKTKVLIILINFLDTNNNPSLPNILIYNIENIVAVVNSNRSDQSMQIIIHETLHNYNHYFDSSGPRC